jgi:hypothetical protein
MDRSRNRIGTDEGTNSCRVGAAWVSFEEPISELTGLGSRTGGFQGLDSQYGGFQSKDASGIVGPVAIESIEASFGVPSGQRIPSPIQQANLV